MRGTVVCNMSDHKQTREACLQLNLECTKFTTQEFRVYDIHSQRNDTGGAWQARKRSTSLSHSHTHTDTHVLSLTPVLPLSLTREVCVSLSLTHTHTLSLSRAGPQEVRATSVRRAPPPPLSNAASAPNLFPGRGSSEVSQVRFWP